MTRVAVLDYGSGNLHSVSRALARVGAEVQIVDSAGDALRADALLIPGVGHFGQCVRALRARGMDRAILEVAASERPVIGVCVGMQVLLEGSEEDGEPGLGLLPGIAQRLEASGEVKVPHMGWNTVRWTSEHPFTSDLGEEAHFYFVHSYAPEADDAIGVTEHGRPFASVIGRGNVFGAQFHPEKSGDAGLELYERIVDAAA